MSSGSENETATSDEPVHLFLFVHGLWGNPNHMLVIEKAVKKAVQPVSPERIISIKPSSFRFWKTYDGIQRCAERVVADLLFEIEALKQTNKCKVTKISIVGYSLGGLISRYVIGILYDLKFFDEVDPIFFCTFATPHVGVHFFRNNFFDKFANLVGQCLFGMTGFQLFITDPRQLLVEMADPDSIYMKGLRCFEKKMLLANIKNDRSVPFFTSFITAHSPFDSLNSINVKYFEDMPSAKIGGVTVWPKFVDMTRSHKVDESEMAGHKNVQEATSIFVTNPIIRYTIFLFAGLILLPFYVPLIICISSGVSAYSILKVKLSSAPEIKEHWASVREAVFHGGVVDAKHAKQGNTRRAQRLHLARHESFKGDTSLFTENAMEQMLAAEQNFVQQPTEMIEESPSPTEGEEESTNELQRTDISEGSADELLSDAEITQKTPASSIITSLLTPKRVLNIKLKENDRIIKKHMDLLEWDKTQEIPLFEDKIKLPLSEKYEKIVSNLNDIDWIKIAVYHHLFNAHDSIVARRGDMKNPKGTCTIYFWTSIMRNHILERDSANV